MNENGETRKPIYGQGPVTAGPGQTPEQRRLELLGLAGILVLALGLMVRQLGALLPWFIYEDELRTTEVALRLLQHRSLDPAYALYPAFSFYLNALFYLAWALAGQIGLAMQSGLATVFEFFAGMTPTDPVIVMLSRWVSLLFGLGSLLFSHLLARQYLSWRWALFSTLLLALNPVFLSMSAVGKIDTINLFWFMVGFYAGVNYFHRGSRFSLLLAAIAAGLATMTKNNFQLIIALAFLLIFRGLRERKPLFRIAFGAETWLAGVVLALTLFLSSPYSLLRLGQTLQNAGWLYLHSEIISFYHTDTAAWWRDRYFYCLSVILPFTYGLPLFWVMVGGAVHYLRKYGSSDPYLAYNFIWYTYIFAAGSGGPRGGSYPYYLFMCVMPLGIMIGVEWLQDLTLSAKRWVRFLGFAATAVVGVWALLSAPAYYQMNFLSHDRLGPWLQRNLPAPARALLVSVYLPTPALGLKEVKAVWPQDFTAELIQSFNPDVIIIDTWTIAGFRKFYRHKPVAPLVDSLLQPGSGFIVLARFAPSYFGRSYYAWLDPEHEVELIVLGREKLFQGRRLAPIEDERHE